MRKHDSASFIGGRIKEIRIKLNIQQKEMAETLQIAASYLSGIEKGNANPGPELFVRLASEYHVNMNYLFTGKGDMFGDAPLKIKKEEFDIEGEMNTIEQLYWLLNNSSYYRSLLLANANKLLFQEKDVIKHSLSLHK
ncbi:MAG TPA: helix-turn-helix transcriptional regulator [Candidatus Deferrimicrobium sp.]|nr:helix-turn-helix transcriptional regulator [Candidatus Deferrimicrobium sp.]